jgi:hypothetical protein
MFHRAETFNQPLNSWDVSSVMNMTSMFADATSFNQPLDMWDVSGVVDMSHMFDAALSFSQNLCQWYYKQLQDPDVLNIFMMSNCTHPSDPNFKRMEFFCSECSKVRTSHY